MNIRPKADAYSNRHRRERNEIGRTFGMTYYSPARTIGADFGVLFPDDGLTDRLASDSFYFAMAAARFTRRERRATFAATGHAPAMLVSNGQKSARDGSRKRRGIH